MLVLYQVYEVGAVTRVQVVKLRRRGPVAGVGRPRAQVGP
jgi:hypothetical protein